MYMSLSQTIVITVQVEEALRKKKIDLLSSAQISHQQLRFTQCQTCTKRLIQHIFKEAFSLV